MAATTRRRFLESASSGGSKKTAYDPLADRAALLCEPPIAKETGLKPTHLGELGIAVRHAARNARDDAGVQHPALRKKRYT